MDSLFCYINCCKKEELIKNQTNCEINVPLDNTNKNNCDNSQNISFSPDKPELNKFMDTSNIKTTEVNNTINTLNENNNTNNNNSNNNTNINTTLNNNTFNNTIEEIANNNSSNKNNNRHLINNIISNNHNEIRSINKVDTFEIQNQQDFLFCNKKNNMNYSNIISDSNININKALNGNGGVNSSSNNNNTNINNTNINYSNIVVCHEPKKHMSSSMLLNNNNNNKNMIKDSNSKGTVLTLNDLVLNNQNQEICGMGAKLLLSGELFFWKEIIMQTNGIKNSLRKEKDDHVYLV